MDNVTGITVRLKLDIVQYNRNIRKENRNNKQA